MVQPFLEGQSLEDALQRNKIYIINYKDVLEIICRDNRKVNSHTVSFSYDPINAIFPPLISTSASGKCMLSCFYILLVFVHSWQCQWRYSMSTNKATLCQ